MKNEKIELRECPVETAMLLIGNKWKIFVLREILDGAKRFHERQRSITRISQKVLTQNLRAMEKDGLITREVFVCRGSATVRYSYHLERGGFDRNERQLCVHA